MTKLDKIHDRYVKIPQEELTKPLLGKTVWSFEPEEEEESPPKKELLKESIIQVVDSTNHIAQKPL